jgi:guanine nucleotide-binding protein subunit alpha
MIHRTSSLYSQDDPISAALRPPSSETPEEQGMRLQQEAEARRRSEKIDEELRLDRERLKRSKSDVKVGVYLPHELSTLRSCR